MNTVMARRTEAGEAILLFKPRLLRPVAWVLGLAMTVCSINTFAENTEVLPKTNTKVLVREHPKTGVPYVSIIASGQPDRGGPFAGMKKISRRPDYRMLDAKIKSGTIPYEGPVSSRKKVYIFAATLTAGGAAGAAFLPVTAAAGAGTAGGAGALAAAGAGVASGSAGAVAISMKQNPKQEDYTHVSKSAAKINSPK